MDYRGQLSPFIAVLPDCMTYLGGSQFVDSPAIGAYASHLMTEVVPIVGGISCLGMESLV